MLICYFFKANTLIIQSTNSFDIDILSDSKAI